MIEIKQFSLNMTLFDLIQAFRLRSIKYCFYIFTVCWLEQRTCISSSGRVKIQLIGFCRYIECWNYQNGLYAQNPYQSKYIERGTCCCVAHVINLCFSCLHCVNLFLVMFHNWKIFAIRTFFVQNKINWKSHSGPGIKTNNALVFAMCNFILLC